MYLLIPVTASDRRRAGDEQDLVLRGERRHLQGDAGRDAAGEDLVALADQVAARCDGLRRIGAVVDDRQLDRAAVDLHRALGRVREPVAEALDVLGAVGRQQARARVDDPDLVRGRCGRAAAAVSTSLRAARERCEKRRYRRECRDATPVPCLHLPDLREENMDGSAPNLRPDSGLRYDRVVNVSRPAWVVFRRRARAAAAPCRTARSRSARRSPRSSGASPRARARAAARRSRAGATSPRRPRRTR